MFGRGLSSYLTGVAATEQRVRSVLRLFLAEWFVNTDAGIPWTVPDESDVRPILGVAFNRSYSEAVIANAVLGTAGINSVESIEMTADHETRLGEVTVEVITDEGAALSITEAVPAP